MFPGDETIERMKIRADILRRYAKRLEQKYQDVLLLEKNGEDVDSIKKFIENRIKKINEFLKGEVFTATIDSLGYSESEVEQNVRSLPVEDPFLIEEYFGEDLKGRKNR